MEQTDDRRERDPFGGPTFLKRATELRRLEQLPWPKNLFGEPASIAELLNESTHGSDKADDLCPCGCRKEHKHNVSQTLRSPYGRGFNVVYFRSDACKTGWNQKRMAEPVTR